jgi:RHS repeat-associated protein
LNYNYGTNDDGLIQSITDNVDSGRTANYTYDALPRLKTATTAGSANYPAWGLSWTYDRYGNRLSQSVTAGSGPMVSLSVDPTTNHITGSGYGYDANGNMTGDGLNVSMAYDGENHLLSNTQNGVTTTYAYDGKGLRVEKSAGSSTIYIFSGRKVIAEYASGAGVGSPSTEYIYAGENALASVSSGTTTYYGADHLSTRFLMDANDNTIGQRGDYPFGEQWYATGTTTKWQFTSYERDAESSNDYAMARYDVNHLGRFLSPDLLSGSIFDPQSLNRYTYVGNNPVSFTDSTGMLRNPPCHADGRQVICSGFDDSNCTVDGVDSNCSDPLFGLSLLIDSVAQCPNNDCSPAVGNNGYLYFIAFTSDNGFGYFNPLNGNIFYGGTELGLPSLDDPDNQIPGGVSQQQKPDQQQKPNPQPPTTFKQKFCFYTSWLPTINIGAGFTVLTMSGGSGITQLGLGATVGALAETSAVAAAGPYLIVGGAVVYTVRQAVCTQ